MEENGFLLFENFFSEEEAQKITNWANQLENLKEEKYKWAIYKEENKLKSRIEHFLPYQEEIKNFLNNKLQPFLEKTIKQKVYLLKEKMNWKQAGGKGFGAHQDHPAWEDFISSDRKFYSMALFPDGSTKENGCLEFVYNMNKKILENDLNKKGGYGKLIDENKFTWHAMETTNRDLLIFDSYVPHRSHENKTKSSRRVFYFTFNNIQDGDNYEKYYIQKRKEFPPDIEREKNSKYNHLNNKFNLANPIL